MHSQFRILKKPNRKLIIRNINLLVFIFFTTTLSAQCPACNLCSQAEVDAYVVPPGGTITSDLIISGSDISNIDALYGLKNMFFGRLCIVDNPLLENLNGLGQLWQVNAEVIIENNMSLENIDSLDALYSATSLRIKNNPKITSYICTAPFFEMNTGVEISNNALLTDIVLNVPSFPLPKLTVSSNPSLTNIDLTGINNEVSEYTISDNSSLENIDGFKNIPSISSQMTIANNPNLHGYCGLNKIVSADINAPITISGNFSNPSNDEILYEGTCGNFIVAFTGYPTLEDALNEADDYSFIFVARDYTIETTTTFLAAQKWTLVIKPKAKLSFNAPFTNEGIVINHGTVEMLNSALFTNRGAFVNTGTLIAN